MPGGMYTVWNAVTFGHYPQTEILKETADPEFPAPAENAETDPELYDRLTAAAGDGGDDAVIDGIQYIRRTERRF